MSRVEHLFLLNKQTNACPHSLGCQLMMLGSIQKPVKPNLQKLWPLNSLHIVVENETEFKNEISCSQHQLWYATHGLPQKYAQNNSSPLEHLCNHVLLIRWLQHGFELDEYCTVVLTQTHLENKSFSRKTFVNENEGEKIQKKRGKKSKRNRKSVFHKYICFHSCFFMCIFVFLSFLFQFLSFFLFFCLFSSSLPRLYHFQALFTVRWFNKY